MTESFPDAHAAHAIGISQVCQFPLQMIVKKSDTTIHMFVYYETLGRSSLGRFYLDHQAENNWRRWDLLSPGGQRVQVVGLNGGVVSLFMEFDGNFMNLRCHEGNMSHYRTSTTDYTIQFLFREGNDNNKIIKVDNAIFRKCRW